MRNQNMDSQWESEIKEEMSYLEKKKVEYGWTQDDADRYNKLKSLIGE